MMIAGSTAFVTGVATAAVGLLASPALADATVTYSCTVTPDNGASLNIPSESVTITGTAPTDATVGDTITLTGVSLSLPVPQSLLDAVPGTTTISGTVESFSISAAETSSTTPHDVAGLTIADTTVDTTSGTTLVTSTANVPNITADEEGDLTLLAQSFHLALSLTGANATPVSVDVQCDPSDTQVIATVTVKPKPVDTGGNGGNGGTSNQGGNNGGNGNGGATGGAGGGSTTPPPHNSPAPNHNTNTNTNTNTGTENAPQARGTLANTGVPYTIPMTATGAALLLAGAVMLVFGRRRRELVVDGAPTED